MFKIVRFLLAALVLPFVSALDYVGFIIKGFFAGFIFLRAGLFKAFFRMAVSLVYIAVSWGLLPGILIWSFIHWGPMPGAGVLLIGTILSPTDIWKITEQLMGKLYIRPMLTWTKQSDTETSTQAGITVTFMCTKEEFQAFRSAANTAGLWFVKPQWETLVGMFCYRVRIVQNRETME